MGGGIVRVELAVSLNCMILGADLEIHDIVFHRCSTCRPSSFCGWSPKL